MANFRIFVEKRTHFNVEAQSLCADFQQNLHLPGLSSVRVINFYDIFNIDSADFERAQQIVFAEAPVDEVYLTLDLNNLHYLAIEPLPGQYDQRADSALQALQLLDINSPNLTLTSGKVIILDGINAQQLELVKHYYINPLEMREKNLACLQAEEISADTQSVAIFSGFTHLTGAELRLFRQQQNLAMSQADLECIQNYFKSSESRDPSETEIRVLDTYWSDHCRHTTFETQLQSIEFAAGKYQQLFQETFDSYLQSRQKVYGAKAKERAITLMDLATICGKELRAEGKLDDVEFSEEINACSLFVDVEIDGKTETWSLQFKNETHNHPTEIEPYGGASTCVGGAIRDPLSGRSYVYQAMRLSGAGNPLEAIEDTLTGKLPQRKITAQAARGFSSYGNQIGLATTHVTEIYHPGYKAKHMEVGLVVAAAPYANIRREVPTAGDVIILLGGRTGRDGCGGATGSSKEHDVNSAALCGAEVQKGNPVTERKIQRLFRNPELTQLIKRCNDFGAGGVAVAIGELAAGIKINLDKVPTKYFGLSGTELAISESQERMALVVAAADALQVIELATTENLEAVIVAEVTAEERMIMEWRGQKIVNLAREFLNTNGAQASATVMVAMPQDLSVSTSDFSKDQNFFAKLRQTLSEINSCSQHGMVDMFDATIGSGTVLMPYGGKYQLTPAQVSVQKLPLLSCNSDRASIASYGFDPYLSEKSPFHGALYAVIDSVAKQVAAGADYRQIKFSFQEYFEKLGTNPAKWGKPFAALLGAYAAQQGFGLAAIGGKDSMSGTFNELNVPPTLISFAVAPTYASQIISPEFKAAGNYIYAFIPKSDAHGLPNFAELKLMYSQIHELIGAGIINAAAACGRGGISEAIAKMAFGNKIGVSLVNSSEVEWFSPHYGSLVFSSQQKLEHEKFILLGTTTAEQLIQKGEQAIELNELITAWQATFAPLFPLTASSAGDSKLSEEFVSSVVIKPSANHKGTPQTKPRVIIPVFPGTNCEYDSLRAFNAAGATAESLVFNNLSPDKIHQSISALAAHIDNAQILMLPGGFSAGDEPDGSAKFIAAILRNQQISDAIHQLLARDGLILGICNGFQALIKSGLLPYGEISPLDRNSATLSFNLLGRHISRLSATKVVSNSSPWLSSMEVGSIHQVAMSHGEGRLIVNADEAARWFTHGQVACQYVDLNGNPTLDGLFNPNGSDYAIEALTSLDGRILGKMGHSERMGDNLYKNVPGDKVQDIFKNGVRYFG